MRLTTRLFVFAVGLTAVLGVAKATGNLRQKHERNRRETVVHVAAVPAIPPIPPIPASPAGPALAGGHEQIRILTKKGTAFMSLRDDYLVAGLSDSIRQLAAAEMKKDLAKETAPGIGRMVKEAVRSGVEKLLDKEIVVPVTEIRDIDYKQNRIVIVYKKGDAPGFINFETIKSDHDQTLLEQFNEADARRLVEAVRARIR